MPHRDPRHSCCEVAREYGPEKKKEGSDIVELEKKKERENKKRAQMKEDLVIELRLGVFDFILDFFHGNTLTCQFSLRNETLRERKKKNKKMNQKK